MKKALILTVAAVMTLHTVAAVAQNSPLHILYLGTFDVGSRGGGGGGGGRVPGGFTNYAYLPGQTLAPQAIYFDHLSNLTYLTDKYLSHFDAVVQVMPDSQLAADQKALLANFQKAGKGIIKYADGNRPPDAVLREEGQVRLGSLPGRAPTVAATARRRAEL
jgi:hypothetical protein